MTREDIIRMAREAGFPVPAFPESDVDLLILQSAERFAALVVAAEREACAQMADHILKEGGGTYGDAIRARGQA